LKARPAAGREQKTEAMVQRRDSAGRRPPSFVAPFVWAAVISVGTILAVVGAIWLTLQ
jgi:hypothetical protein